MKTILIIDSDHFCFALRISLAFWLFKGIPKNPICHLTEEVEAGRVVPRLMVQFTVYLKQSRRPAKHQSFGRKFPIGLFRWWATFLHSEDDFDWLLLRLICRMYLAGLVRNDTEGWFINDTDTHTHTHKHVRQPTGPTHRGWSMRAHHSTFPWQHTRAWSNCTDLCFAACFALFEMMNRHFKGCPLLSRSWREH